MFFNRTGNLVLRILILWLNDSPNSLALTSVDQFYLFVLRSDNNKIMVENYGETVQDRQIPNPVRTFGEAYADFRKSPAFYNFNSRNTDGNPHSCRIPARIDPFHFGDLFQCRVYSVHVCFVRKNPDPALSR